MVRPPERWKTFGSARLQTTRAKYRKQHRRNEVRFANPRRQFQREQQSGRWGAGQDTDSKRDRYPADDFGERDQMFKVEETSSGANGQKSPVVNQESSAQRQASQMDSASERFRRNPIALLFG